MKVKVLNVNFEENLLWASLADFPTLNVELSDQLLFYINVGLSFALFLINTAFLNGGYFEGKIEVIRHQQFYKMFLHFRPAAFESVPHGKGAACQALFP